MSEAYDDGDLDLTGRDYLAYLDQLLWEWRSPGDCAAFGDLDDTPARPV